MRQATGKLGANFARGKARHTKSRATQFVKTLMCFAFLFFVSSAIAEPMHFEVNGSGGNCCSWIQATGGISPDTPAVFEAFLRSSEFVPKVVRLNSGGGSVGAGVALGEIFRARGFATEVGSTKLNPESVPIPGSQIGYAKAPGRCASACAFAFLGGIERTLDPDSKLAFHRSHFGGIEPTGNDAQMLIAALLLYIVNMGVDARLIKLATEAGPSEARWIRPNEARELQVTTVDPNSPH